MKNSVMAMIGFSLALLASAAAIPTTPVNAATVEVNLSNTRFSPVDVRVQPGDTVILRNTSALLHTARLIGHEDVLKVNEFRPGASLSFTVPASFSPGSYVLDCGMHRGMSAVLVITDTVVAGH